MRVAGRALDNRWIRVNDSVAVQNVDDVGYLLRVDVAVELRAGEDARVDDRARHAAASRSRRIA